MEIEFIATGKVVKLNLQDKDLLDGYYWTLDGRGYAIGSKPKIGMVRLHRLVAERMFGDITKYQVDHINGDKRDNRRVNLRLASHGENQHNRGKNRNNSSGYKGVSWAEKNRKYRASIMKDRKAHHLGLFDNPEDAARAYNRAAILYHGDYAHLNQVDPLI